MRSRPHRGIKCLPPSPDSFRFFAHTPESLERNRSSALPAEALRLIRPLVLKALRFALMNANPAALTGRPAKHLGSPGRAFAFNAPLSAVPLRSKQRNQRKEFFQCNNSANNAL